MKTQQIMIMRFMRRKLEILDTTGEYVAERSTDDETRVTRDGGAEWADDDTSDA
jgi:hypothetical protein